MPDAHRNRGSWYGKGGSRKIPQAVDYDADSDPFPLMRRWSMARVWLVATATGLLLSVAGPAHAEYHGQKASAEVHKWFSALRIPPIYAEGCCGYHRDCWETKAYYKEGRWWALYRPFAADPKRFDEDARFIRIPRGSVETPGHLYRHYNPTGRPVLCALPHVPPRFGKPSVYCFVPPPTSF